MADEETPANLQSEMIFSGELSLKKKNEPDIFIVDFARPWSEVRNTAIHNPLTKLLGLTSNRYAFDAHAVARISVRRRPQW